MRKCVVVASLTLFAALGSRGQSYPVSAIPDSLKENANMVVRLDEKAVEIKSPGKMVVREHHVYTILNENALRYATYKTFYDQFISLNYVNAAVYDANGKEVGHFKKKDMQDLAQEDGISLMSDQRYKLGSFSYHSYPFTVDFEEEDEINGLQGIDGWELPGRVKIALETSRYILIVPKDYKIRYKLINASFPPVVTEKSGKLTYLWEFKNVAAIEAEPYAVPWTAYEPYMLVGLSDVEVQGYKGNMSTWDEFGKFYGSLQKGRDILPDNIKSKVHALTDGVSDPEKKVAILYDYLQKNTHYVSVQLGIGGWQTFDAAYVANNKYGDCKALSNFMVSLLKEVGIKANAVVIYGGEQHVDFIKDFVSDPFNHVICCVPLTKDTIWLECTSQYLPAGYLSDFTSNRYGLMIKDNGGELVHTPVYGFPDNIQVRNVFAALDENGVLKVQSNSSYQAGCQDELEERIDAYSKEDQLRYLKTSFDLPTYDVNAFEYHKDYSRRLPVIRETLQLTVTDYAQVSGRRIFINPDILSRSGAKLLEDKDRRLDIELKNQFCHIDSVQITIPAGYELEGNPRNISLQSKFGKYEMRTAVESGKIICYRKSESYAGRFSKSEYPNLVQFYNEIYKSDHSKIVLVKKS